ncbi:hypothetical protein QTO34_016101 [Cnephaeus nilssonii]|uniref:Testican-1 n=1 Tax=Cnephaeus nilssonii TaxID=3371016 RepID=A0AA40LTI2_CNENI|nr:hypothetical protein QTO34_016101 [Eptesicus nilssonii]
MKIVRRTSRPVQQTRTPVRKNSKAILTSGPDDLPFEKASVLVVFWTLYPQPPQLSLIQLGPESLFQSCIKDVDNHIPGRSGGGSRSGGTVTCGRQGSPEASAPGAAPERAESSGARALPAHKAPDCAAAAAGAQERGQSFPRDRATGAPATQTRGPGPAPKMPAIAVLAAAAAWCFLQVHSRRLEALAGRVGPNGNFLDNDQWLSTVSQYDRDKYWNRFRDVSTGGGRLREGSGAGGGRCGPPGQLAGPGSGAVLPENFQGELGRPAPLCLLPVVQVWACAGRGRRPD